MQAHDGVLRQVLASIVYRCDLEDLFHTMEEPAKVHKSKAAAVGRVVEKLLKDKKVAMSFD